MEAPNKPSRAPSIDNLQTLQEMTKKRKDIAECLRSAKTPEGKTKYWEQKVYINNAIRDRHGDIE